MSDQLYRGTKFSSENTLPLLSKKIPFARIGLSAIVNMEYERNKFSNGDSVENSIGGQVYSARSRRLSGKFSAGTSPFDWLSLDAGADVSASQTGVLGTWGGTIVSASANFMSGIAISRGLFFSADAKFYYNNHNSAKALFIGCGLEYKYKDWQFFLTCDNLADVKSYETTILSGVNTFYHQYKLCGRRIMLGFQCRLF